MRSAALGTDIVDAVYDGDGVDPQYREKLNYANCFAFENFEIETNPLAGNFDNIDVNMVNTPHAQGGAGLPAVRFFCQARSGTQHARAGPPADHQGVLRPCHILQPQP